MNVLSVVGARPQFIKAAVVSRALRGAGISELLVHTGQHYDENMSQVFFEELEIPEPDHNLEVGSSKHGEQTGKMLVGIERLLLQNKPDWVLVYGDTNSTLAGTLAAAKLHVPVAHVEAGLRSYNRRMPEELNRVLTDHASDLLFAPTDTAVSNLRREGICEKRIRLVGDVMYDAALYYSQKAETKSRVLRDLALRPREYVLATIHRAENTDEPERLEAILYALDDLSGEISVVWPVHPRTRKFLSSVPEGVGSKIQTIDPVGFHDMATLERHARLVVTDSGGVQKEAFFYEVPCVTLRDETEWIELIDLGWNRLAPPVSSDSIGKILRAALVAPRGKSAQPYGDGTSSQKICSALCELHSLT